MIELVAILDRSGSMAGKEADVISGFNKFIKDQKEIKGKAKLTLVLFDHEYQLVHDRTPLKKVQELTDKTYFVHGVTALLDAVGKTLSSVKKKNKGIVFIFTDGMENASKEYSRDGVKKLVEQRKENGWEIHFIGADIDAFAQGGDLGIDKNLIFQTTADSNGINKSMRYGSRVTMLYRTNNDSKEK